MTLDELRAGALYMQLRRRYKKFEVRVRFFDGYWHIEWAGMLWGNGYGGASPVQQTLAGNVHVLRVILQHALEWREKIALERINCVPVFKQCGFYRQAWHGTA